MEVRVDDELAHLDDAAGELVGDERHEAALGALLALVPEALELLLGVAAEDLDNLLNVLLVHLRDGAVGADAHVVGVLGIGHAHAGEDLKRGASNASLVGGGVLDEDDADALEGDAGIVGDEQVSALNNVLEAELVGASQVTNLALDHRLAGRALHRDELMDIVKADGGRAAAARDEDVSDGELAEVEGVTEGLTVLHEGAVGEGAVLVGNSDEEALGGELGGVEVLEHLALGGEAEELLAVEALGVIDGAGAIDHTNVLFLGELHLVGAEVTVGAAGLELGEISLGEGKLLVDALDAGADAAAGHAVSVVGDTAEGGALTGGEGLPLLVAAGLGVHGGNGGEGAGGVLIRAEEEDLGGLHGAGDALGVGYDEVAEGVNVLQEGALLVIGGGGLDEDGALAAALGDVLVLHVLGIREVIVLGEEVDAVAVVGILAGGDDHADAAAGNVGEADVEANELRANNKVDAIGEAGVVHLADEGGVEAVGDGSLVGLEKVGAEDGKVEGDERPEDLAFLLGVVSHLLLHDHLELGARLSGGALREVLEEHLNEADVGGDEVVNKIVAHDLTEENVAEGLEAGNAHRLRAELAAELGEVLALERRGEVEGEVREGVAVDHLTGINEALIVEGCDGVVGAVGEERDERGRVAELLLGGALDVEGVDVHAVGESLAELLNDGGVGDGADEGDEGGEVALAVGDEAELEGDHITNLVHSVDGGDAVVHHGDDGLVAGAHLGVTLVDEVNRADVLDLGAGGVLGVEEGGLLGGEEGEGALGAGAVVGADGGGVGLAILLLALLEPRLHAVHRRDLIALVGVAEVEGVGLALVGEGEGGLVGRGGGAGNEVAIGVAGDLLLVKDDAVSVLEAEAQVLRNALLDVVEEEAGGGDGLDGIDDLLIVNHCSLYLFGL